MTRIILVRHGQTAWNREVRFRGQVDVPLNDVGHAQAQAVARTLRVAGWLIAAVYSSPLSRAIETARPTADALGLPMQPEPGLLDINYGEWGGLSPAEAEARDPALLARWQHDPGTAVFPGGEDLAAVQARTLAALARWVAAHPEQTIMAVGHVVTNRALILGVLGASLAHFWQIGQDNAAISIIEDYYGRLVVATLNDTCHLDYGAGAHVLG
ncbi:MAG: histidine phosphatase family protein [Chloroflexi bacterium]|nr:histidine phosphatase family protein [Chloroflexota bacterium]MBU1749199.1 histidine phosphatase family protein [Chloroflexota bacterium]